VRLQKNLFDHYACTLVTSALHYVCMPPWEHAANISWPTSLLLADAAGCSRWRAINTLDWKLTQHVLTTDGTSQCWPRYWLASLTLYFALIQALDVHGRRLLITVNDNQSVITVYARTSAGKQRPHPYVIPQCQVGTFRTLTDL